MSTTEQPHPILLQLESIEDRLGRIEQALGIEEKPKAFIRKRTIVIVLVSLVFISGLMWGVNYVINELFASLPV